MIDSNYQNNKLRENASFVARTLENRGITTSYDFVGQCMSNANHAGNYLKYLKYKDVENAIQVANSWKALILNDEEYAKFVTQIIFKLYRIQCFAVSNCPTADVLYIGNMCKIKQEEIGEGNGFKLRRTFFAVGSKHVVNA